MGNMGYPSCGKFFLESLERLISGKVEIGEDGPTFLYKLVFRG